MKKKVGIIKRNIAIFLIIAMSINSFAAIVSDNDGSAFITKFEFDALKNSFQKQIDNYNSSIDSKIDGSIASYLAGLKLSTNQKCNLPTSQNVFKTFDEVSLPWVHGTHDLTVWFSQLDWASTRTDASWRAYNDQARMVTQIPDKQAKAVFIDGDATHPILVGYASNWNFFAKDVRYNEKYGNFMNTATGSNLNRYYSIRKINMGENGGKDAAASIHNWHRSPNITSKNDVIYDFTNTNIPYMGCTTDCGGGEPYREACVQLWPRQGVYWDMTAYDVSDKLVSVTSVDTPVNCLSLTGKPNRILYKFYDFYSTNATTRANARAAVWAEIQKYTMRFLVHGWYCDFIDGKNKRYQPTTIDVNIDDIAHIEPSGWTDANASSYRYDFYMPFIAYDNIYLTNTTKLWTAEYDSLMTDANFKNFVGLNNVWEHPSNGTTYYNISAGLILINEAKNGEVTLEVKNTSSNKVIFYVMKEPMDVATGYNINKIIKADKSDLSVNNGVPIAAGNTETIKFNKEQQYILFNFQAVTAANAKTKGGSVSIEKIDLAYAN